MADGYCINQIVFKAILPFLRPTFLKKKKKGKKGQRKETFINPQIMSLKKVVFYQEY